MPKPMSPLNINTIDQFQLGLRCVIYLKINGAEIILCTLSANNIKKQMV